MAQTQTQTQTKVKPSAIISSGPLDPIVVIYKIKGINSQDLLCGLVWSVLNVTWSGFLHLSLNYKYFLVKTFLSISFSTKLAYVKGKGL